MLKQLMLRKKINSARAALEEFLKADNFKQRSADLEAAIAEADVIADCPIECTCCD